MNYNIAHIIQAIFASIPVEKKDEFKEVLEKESVILLLEQVVRTMDDAFAQTMQYASAHELDAARTQHQAVTSILLELLAIGMLERSKFDELYKTNATAQSEESGDNV